MKSDNPKHLTYLTLTKQRNTLNKHFSALHSRPQVFREELAKLAANAKARSNAEATPEAEPTPQATPQATSLGWEW
jgi:peptidoglycan hydrolase CwlO-like protein